MLLRRYFVIAICGVFIASGAVSGQAVKKAVGDKVSFKLDTIVPPVTSITWKQVKGTVTIKAIEWEDGEATTTPNPRFKDITTLDEKTGQMNITNLKLEHSGVYTIDVSGKEQTQRFTLTVMDRVPKPVIKTENIKDNTDVVYLNCKYTESITWHNSAGETLNVQENGKAITVEKKEGNPENTYTCTLKNEVSEETSDPVHKKDLFNDESTGGPWWIVFIVIPIIGIICAVLYKCNKNVRELVGKCPCIEGNTRQNAHNGPPVEKMERGSPGDPNKEETPLSTQN